MGAAAAKLSAKRDLAIGLIPVVAVDGDLFITQSGEVGFAFISSPLWAADSHTASRVNALLNMGWPVNSALQFCLWFGPDVEPTLSAYVRQRPVKSNEEAKIRAKFLRDGTRTPLFGKTIVRNGQLVITFKMKAPHGVNRLSQAFIDRLKTLRDGCEETLRAVGFSAERMNGDSLLRFYKTLFVRTRDADWRFEPETVYEENEILGAQVFDYDTHVNVARDRIDVGEDTIKVLSIKRFPAFGEFGEGKLYVAEPMGGNRGIPENVLITASIIFPDPEKERATIEGKRSYVQHQAYGPLLKHIPELAELKQGFDEIHHALSDGDRPIKLYLGMSIFVPNEEGAAAAAAVSNARTYWRDLGFQLVEDRFIALPAFLNQIPFGADLDGYKDLFRYKTMATRHCIPMLPLFGDWKGTPVPALTFISRAGQIMRYDLFDSDSNYNLVIAAQSGSGKSFLTNEIIKSYIRIGGLVWVIDVGRSYEKLCHAMDGQFMVFTKDSDICLNPFTMVKDYEEEADMLVGLIQAMASPTEKMSDYQTSKLRQILKSVWNEKGNDMMVDDVADALIRYDDNRVQDIGHQLYSFTRDGEYGRFFHGRNNLSFNNPFTVLELEELKGRKHLQQVVLLQLIYQIQQIMYLGGRARRKIAIIDEAWDLMKEGDVAKFIETGYRRFRKYGGSAVTITQSVNDLYENDTGRAIAESSAHKMLLGQQASAIDQLQKEQRLSLSDGGYQLLKSVRTVPGVYSEIFFMSPYGSGIGRLVVDEFHKLLYSTKAEDVHDIDRYRKRGMSVEEAIKQVLADRQMLGGSNG